MQTQEEINYDQERSAPQKLNFSFWWQLLRIAKPYHKHLWWVIVTMAICAAADAVFPQMTGYAIDNFIAKQTTEGLGGFIAVYVAILLVQCVTIFLFLLLCGKVETGVCYLIRQLGFRKLQELPFSYYDRMPVGYLLSRMTTDTQRLADTIGWSLLDLVWGSIFLLMCTVQMFILRWQLALWVVLVIPPLAVISAFFQKRILSAYREVRKTNSQITSAFNEGIMGAQTTKTLVREEANFAEFEELTTKMKTASIRSATLSALFLPIVVSLGSVATALALYKGGMDVMATPQLMTLGTLQIFVSYSIQFFEPIRNIARIFAELQSSQAAAERVLTLLGTEPEIRDSEEVLERFGDNFHPKTENWPAFHGDVDFENVSFRYKDGEEVLTDFTLHVKAGQSIALVGETGSGKSTIVNLLCRFYEPTAGRILIDGVDYRERSMLWLESHLGYVLQQAHMFSGTIRDNICYGRPNAPEDEVIRAAKLANAHEFIARLPKQYDTPVGEGGSLLSAGEKQLISFARAILVDPSLFILDEATSSVDTHSEALIQQAITGILEGRTSFMIAHRLSTVRRADRILVIDKGRIVEEGTHHELIVQKGIYYDLYTSQFQDEQSAAVLKAGFSG